MFDAITDSTVAIKDILVQVEKLPELWIAPSSISLAKIEAKLIGEPTRTIDSRTRLMPCAASSSTS